MTISPKSADGTGTHDRLMRRNRCSLSPGERARVRASVPLTFLFPNNSGSSVSRQRMRSTLLQRIKNYVPNELLFSSQLPIPEAKLLDSHRSKILCPLDIVSLLFGESVMSTIQFNREACFHTIEVEEVNPAGMIAPEFVGAEASVSQPTPHEFFRPSRLLSQSAGAFSVGHGRRLGCCGRFEKNGLTTTLTPTLSPRRGRTARGRLSWRIALDYSKTSPQISHSKTGGAP